MPSRVLLILPTRTYRAAAFLKAARRLKLEVVVAAEEGSTLGHLHPDQELVIDLDDPLATAQVVEELAGGRQIDAVVPVDDAGVLARSAWASGAARYRQWRRPAISWRCGSACKPELWLNFDGGYGREGRIQGRSSSQR